MANKAQIVSALGRYIDAVIAKADDKDDDRFLSMLPEGDRKPVKNYIKALHAALTKALGKQRKTYLDNIKAMPKRVKGYKGTKLHIPAGGVDDATIGALTYILSQYIFEGGEDADMADAYSGPTKQFFESFSLMAAEAVKGAAEAASKETTKTGKKWMEEHTIHFAHEVDRTTHNAVVKVLRDTLETGAGEQTRALVEALPDFFYQGDISTVEREMARVADVNLWNDLYQAVSKEKAFQAYRARRIARTESLIVSEAATLDGWRRIDSVVGKQWMCAGGPRSRKWHIEADGQIVPIDEPFIVKGQKLMHPGDGSLGATPDNIIQCRCRMRAIFRGTKEGDALLEKLGQNQ